MKDAAGAWQRLTPSARAAVLEVVKLLADRWTGEIVIHANEGGIRSFAAYETMTPAQLLDRARRAGRPAKNHREI